MTNLEQDATVGFLNGLTRVTDIIRPTYGGNGTNVVVETKLRPFSMTVNDAETIVQAMKFTEPTERVALGFVKELCSTQDKVAGNGRKTTILMATEIVKGALASKSNKKNLKKELDALIPFIESEIDKRTTKITVDNVKGVATTASENEETGKLLQEIYQQIGSNGILSIEGSKTYETSYKITDGIRFEMTGMLSPEMVHDEEAIEDKRKETKAVYENPFILITKKKIMNEDDINPLLREISDSDNKNLVIFTNDMDSGVASMLVNLHKNGGFTDKVGNFKSLRVLVIKAPSLWQNFVFEDFAKCTGATVIEDASGLSYKNLKLEHLGTCGRIEVDETDTVLTGIKDISEHIKTLATKGDDDSLLRLSWLASKSALLKLGSNSQQDLSLKRLKANDANRSSYLALQYGVVPGGGICLYDIAMNPEDAEGLTYNSSEAAKILCKALQAPLEQARANYGLDINPYTELITEDIVDASQTIKMAVRNAIGIASTVITAPSLVYIPELTSQEMAFQMATRQANPFNQN